ncbi:TonB-dependent receptor [Sunxiuqinia sp. A32]|uniref:TonB-dependent receptor n=1 Tax=Sunxiuqinia sp. A32 TaxID=3461496 RepID=UPI004045F1E3
MRKISIIICFTLIAFVLKAQDQSSILKDTIKIKEVVVTGTPVQVSKHSVPMAVSVVNRQQIEESNESALLPVLNGRVPGLFVTERGITGFGVAAGSAGQISIRGVGGSPTTGVLMLIDGHPQFMGIMGHPLPDSYVASDVERVEVIRGPASVLYGSNAMGGVINIITRKQTKDGVNGNAGIQYGSFNTQKYRASVGFKENGLSLFGSVNHDQTDGHRDNSDFNITNGYVKAGYEINPNFKISSDFSLAKFKATDPGPDTLNAVAGASLDIKRGYWSAKLDNAFDKTSGSLKVFYNFGEHDISDGFHSIDHNAGFDFFQTFNLFEGNNLTLGVDYLFYGGKAENELAMNGQGIVLADTTVNEIGFYGFVQQKIADQISLNVGLRRQHHEYYGDEWIPSSGFAWEFSENMSWKGTVSKGFRSPTIRELFMWNHNPDLKPERIMNYETGLYNTFFNSKLNTELTFYYISGDNMIVTGNMGSLFNSGEIENKGIEFAASSNAVKNLDLSFTYSFTDMKNPVVSTPKHHLFLNATYHLKKFSINGNIRRIAKMDNDATPAVNLESYSVLNAKVNYKVRKNLTIYLSGENLTDESYAVNRYYTMPGITIFSGININF